MGLIVESWVVNRWAAWSLRTALFVLQITVVTYVLHRLHAIATPLALGLFIVAAVLGLAAVVMALVGFVQIWDTGARGSTRAGVSILLVALLGAWPATFLPRYAALPELNDVSTDLVQPPAFRAFAPDARSVAFARDRNGGPRPQLQLAAYPRLGPVIVKRTPAATFDAARHVAARQGFKIVIEDPPDKTRRSGWIEAVDETLVMGFRDDIVIRIVAVAEGSRIDIRSASRYGRHDFGRNAQRVASLTQALRARLDFEVPSEDEVEAAPAVKVKPKPVLKRRVRRRRRKTRRRIRRRSQSSARRARQQIVSPQR